MVEKFKARAISAPIEPRTAGPGGAVQRISAGALGDVARITGEIADRAAAKEGALAGGLAGMRETIPLRNDGTINGDAFDAAALRSHAAMLDGKLREELAALYEAQGHDAVAFNKGVEAIREKRIASMPAQIRPEWEAAVQRQRFPYDREVARRRAEVTQSEDAASLTSMLATREADYGRMAYQGGLDEKADDVLSAEAEKLTLDLLQYGPKEAFTFEGREFKPDDTRAGLLNPQQITDKVIQMADTASVNRMKGSFDRTKGIAGKQEFLNAFREDYAEGDGIASKMTLRSVEQLEAWMEAKIRGELADLRAVETAVRAEIADIRSSLSDYRSYAADALMPPPGAIETLQARALRTGDPEILAEVEGLAGLVQLGQQATQASPLRLGAAIRNRREHAEKNGIAPQDAAALGLMETIQASMTTALKKDPMSWAQRAGVVDVEPLAFDEAAAQQGQIKLADGVLSKRRQAAMKVSSLYGVPMRPFTEEEVSLAAELERAGGANVLTLAQQVVSEFGSDAPSALAQISDQAPMLAHLGGLLSQGSRSETVQAATRGMAMLTEAKGVSSGLTQGTSGARAQTQLASLDNLPQTKAAIERTANAIYVGRRGLNAAYDEAAYDAALQEAAGATFINGVQFGGLAEADRAGSWFFGAGGLDRGGAVIVPNWMRADALDEAIDSMSAVDWTVGGGGYPPVDAAGQALPLETLKRARLVSVGSGRYELRVLQDGEEVSVASQSPKLPGAYVLDLNLLRNFKWNAWEDFTQ